MKKLFALLVLVSWSAFAGVQPFQQYIDYHKFVQLEPEQQHEFLLNLMVTVAELEQDAIDAGKLQSGVDPQKKTVQLKLLKQVLQELSQQLMVPNAFANILGGIDNPPPNDWCSSAALSALKPTGKTCMYGSYRSTMAKVGNIEVCVRPACSSNNDFREEYNMSARSAGCGYGQLACNPALFGVNGNNKPDCVKLDYPTTQADGKVEFSEVAHNASLACFMEVMALNETARAARLTALANNIKSNSSVAKKFNQMLYLITNICICGDTAFQNNNNVEVASYLTNVDNGYVKYMNGQRSCNSLLNQTALLTDKIVSTNIQCQQQLLPPKLQEFNQSIQAFKEYSSRVDRKIAGTRRGNGTALNPSNLRDRRDAMYFLRANNIDDNGQAGNQSNNGLDKVLALDNAKKAGTALNQLSCPLEFPDPQRFTCEIAGQALRGADGKVKITATVTVKGGSRANGSAQGITAVAWKLGGRAVEGNTNELKLENQEFAAEANNLQVEAAVTSSEATNSPIACSQDIAITASQELAGCSIDAVEATVNGDKVAIAVDKNKIKPVPTTAILPENISVTWQYNNADADLAQLPKPADLTQPIAFTAIVKREGKPDLKCNGSATIAATTPAENTCAVTATLAAIADKADKMKLTASATANPATKDGDVFTWTVPGQAANAPAVTGPSIDQEIAKVTEALKVKAKLKRKDGPEIECTEGTAAVPTVTPTNTPPAQPLACTLSLLYDPTKQEVQATVAGNDLKTGTAITYSNGFKANASNAKVAVKQVKQEAQEQTVEVAADYKDKDDKQVKCNASLKVGAAARQPAATGAPMPQQGQQMLPPLPDMPDLFFQGIR